MPNFYGSVGGLMPPTIHTPLPCGKRLAREQAFAIVNSLGSALSTHGLSDAVLWDYVKRSHKVESRSELSERDWVVLAARLFAVQKSLAQGNKNLLCRLVSEIRATLGTCRVFRGFNNGTFKKVYEGVIIENIKERCQRDADATGCFLNVHGADSPDSRQRFEPAEYAPDPNMPPFAPNDPNRPTKVFEIHRKGNETQTVEISFPDCSDLAGWGQRHADNSGFDTIITDRMGHNVIMEFLATPAPAPPSVEDVAGSTDVVVNGQAWLLLNQWKDQWHWVKLDRTMERHIATADNRQSAVESLVAYIGGGVCEQKKTATEKCGHNRCERCRYGYMSECLSTQEIK